MPDTRGQAPPGGAAPETPPAPGPSAAISPSGELTLGQLQASPIFRRMQSEHDQAVNELAETKGRLSKIEGQLKGLKSQADKELLEQYGDSPEVRSLLDRLHDVEEREDKVEEAFDNLKKLKFNLGEKQRVIDANEIHAQFPTVPLETLMECNSKEEMLRFGNWASRQAAPAAATPTQMPGQPQPTEHLDSGTSTVPGGKRKYTLAELEKMSPQEYARLDEQGAIDIGGR